MMSIPWQDPLIGFNSSYALSVFQHDEKKAQEEKSFYQASLYQVANLFSISFTAFDLTRFIKTGLIRTITQIAIALLIVPIFQLPCYLLATIKSGDYKHFSENPKLKSLAATRAWLQEVLVTYDEEFPDLSQKSIQRLETFVSVLPTVAKSVQIIEMVVYAVLGNYVRAVSIAAGLSFDWLDGHQWIPLPIAGFVRSYAKSLGDLATLMDPSSFLLLKAVSIISLSRDIFQHLPTFPTPSAEQTAS